MASTLRRIAPWALGGAILMLALLWWQRVQAPARAEPPGPVAIGFAQSMSLHHQQAIDMALLMLDGRPTPLTHLARTILYAQLQELGQMQGWLQLWDQPLLRHRPDMTWMLSGSEPPGEEIRDYLLACERSPRGMPGLASPLQMERLRALDGRERDVLFLQLMLEHHQGGLPMAGFAGREARVPAVRRLAAHIALEQAKEAELIRRAALALSTSVEPAMP